MDTKNIIAERVGKTIYKEDGKVIKLFDSNYSKSDILNEALNQARVEETELKVPSILEVTKIDDKWAIITQYVEGKTLAQLMEERPDKFDEYLNLFLDIQMEVHSQKCSLLKRLKDKMDDKISQTDLDAIVRYDLHTRLESMPKHLVLCHGDFNPSNVVITESGEHYIIDWAHATQGNASADVARTYLLFWLEGRINTAEKYLDLYCQKTGKSKPYVQKWIPIVAASQLLKGKKEEKEFLTHWATVVDYE